MANPVSRYSIGYVTKDFTDDLQPWQHLAIPDLEKIRYDSSTMRRLSNDECIAEYTSNLFGLSSLLVVSSNVTMADERSFETDNPQSSLIRNDTTLNIAMDWRLNSDWMCTAWSSFGTRSRYTCTRKFLEPYAGNWTVVQHDPDPSHSVSMRVDYCLVLDDLQDMRKKCVLRTSKMILALVALLNLVKCICIVCTVKLHNQFRLQRGHRYRSRDGSITRTLERSVRTIFDSKTHLDPLAPCLVTVGDAIASFLDHEDNHTRTFVFATKRDFLKRGSWNKNRSFPTTVPERWYRAAGLTRWIVTVSL